MSDRKGWKEIEAFARSINPNLPDDLSGHEIRIHLGKDGQSAIAVPVKPRPLSDKGER